MNLIIAPRAKNVERKTREKRGKENGGKENLRRKLICTQFSGHRFKIE